MKLELKHIAPYLPYELKIYHSGGSVVPLTLDKDESASWTEVGFPASTLLKVHYLYPILRPLSNLYKTLEDGSVPIIEVFKMLCTEDEPISSFELKVHLDYLEVDEDAMFYFQEGSFRYVVNKTIEGFIPNQLELLNYLFENHFDIYDLIGQKLAVDINTITL